MTGINSLEEYISKEEGIPLAKMIESASLFHDLGIAGEDGYNLMHKMSKEFNFDLGDFDYERYFGVELPFNPIVYFFDLIRGRNRLAEIDRLEVGHLKAVIRNKGWFKPQHPY